MRPMISFVGAFGALLSSSALAQFAPQTWPADQDGANFICADVGYFQANNLTGSGTGFACTDPTGKLVRSATPCVASGAVYYQFVDDPSVGTQPQRGHLGFGETAATLCTTDDGPDDRTNAELCAVAGNPANIGSSTHLVTEISTNAYGQVTFGSSVGLGPSLAMSGGNLIDQAYEWVSRSTNAPVNAVNMGALASGLVCQTVTTGVSAPRICAAGTDYQAPLVACTDYVSLSCVSGATDLGGTNATPTVIGIENDAAMRGDILVTATAAPGTPAAGKGRIYYDSTAKTLMAVNDAGGKSHTVQSRSAFTSFWVNSISDSGVAGIAQPAFSDLTGSTTCAQLPALTGGATSSAGSCATTVNFTGLTGSATCAQLPAQTGDSTRSAGSCAAKNVAITETSGPQQLTIAGIPSLNPLPDVLVRDGVGSNTIIGLPPGAIADYATKHDYFINSAVNAGLITGEWVATSSSGFIGTGITIEYPNDFKALHVAGAFDLIASAGVVTGPVTCTITRNGSNISGTGIAFTPGTTANGVYTTGTQTTGSTAVSDTYGLFCQATAGLTGATFAWSYQMVLTP